MAAVAEKPTNYPASLMTEVRKLARDGWGPTALHRIIAAEHDPAPSLPTIKAWINESYAARSRESQRLNKARKAAANATFRLHGNPQSKDYMLAFARCLVAAGVPVLSAWKVLTVLFERPPTRETLRVWLINEERARAVAAAEPVTHQRET